jgi:hypothetical protein
MSARVPAMPPEIIFIDKSGRFSIITSDSIIFLVKKAQTEAKIAFLIKYYINFWGVWQAFQVGSRLLRRYLPQ